MAPLLITVAILQYQWARELSASTEARIDTNLEALMTRWLLDLNDQLSAPCIALQVGPDAGERDGWSDYLDRYLSWRKLSDVSTREYGSFQLVDDIYIWESSSESLPRLWRFDLSRSKIAKSSVPDDLMPLLKRLKGKSSSLLVAASAWQVDGLATQGVGSTPSALARRFRAMSGWQFDPDLPAFVHPILHHERPEDSQTRVSRTAVDWIMILLNNSAIRNHLLPELAMRNFGGPNGLQYDLAVIAKAQSSTVLYSSDPRGVRDLSKFRTTMNVFDSTGGDPPPSPNTNAEWRSVRDATWRDVHASLSFPVMQNNLAEYQGWVLELQPKVDSGTTLANTFWRRSLILGGLLLLMLVANMILVILATQRADRFGRLQMEFIASVSHELRTPLAAIMSAGENLKDGFIPSQNSLAFYGSLITNKSRQLIQLVDRILLFASTLSGKTQYVVRPLAVADIFQAVRKETAALLEGLGYTVEQHVEPGLPPVQGDLSGIVACLQNFITNATKYGGKDRWIRLSAKRQELGKFEEVQISVEDHGQGIADSDLSHIFEAFYRSPSAVSSQIPGTGLGLAVAKNIAEALGGRISVQTEIGVGTTFVLHLPVITHVQQPLAVEIINKHE